MSEVWLEHPYTMNDYYKEMDEHKKSLKRCKACGASREDEPYWHTANRICYGCIEFGTTNPRVLKIYGDGSRFDSVPIIECEKCNGEGYTMEMGCDNTQFDPISCEHCDSEGFLIFIVENDEDRFVKLGEK